MIFLNNNQKIKFPVGQIKKGGIMYNETIKRYQPYIDFYVPKYKYQYIDFFKMIYPTQVMKFKKMSLDKLKAIYMAIRRSRG